MGRGDWCEVGNGVRVDCVEEADHRESGSWWVERVLCSSIGSLLHVRSTVIHRVGTFVEVGRRSPEEFAKSRLVELGRMGTPCWTRSTFVDI
jgi:hypothetical protein